MEQRCQQRPAIFSRGLAKVKIVISAWVLASGLVGCSGNGSEETVSKKVMLNANPQTTDFAVYAQNSVALRDRAAVLGGDVGVGLAGTGPFLDGANELTIIAGAHVDLARSVLANRLSLRDSAKVGDIQVNQVTTVNNATFAHRYAFPSSMPVLPPTAAVTAGTAALNVSAGAMVVANPGSYAAVTVGDKGILRLNGGVYQVASVQIGNDGRIEALAPVQLRVAGRFAALDRAFIGAKSGVTLKAGDVRIEVSGKNGTSGSLTDTPKAAAFGNDGKVNAVMLVPKGTLTSGQRAVVVGAFVAKDVWMDLDSSITYQSGVGPSACLQSCDDGNPCTVDSCLVGECAHPSSAPGTSCSDSNACNGAETCDGKGSCQAGTPITCPVPDQCHTAGVCDRATGLCSNPEQTDGTTCNDANPCTKTDVCSHGVCAGTVYPCDDGLGCTANVCNGDGTCSFPVSAGNCNIGNACYAAGTTNPGNQCEQCTPETAQSKWSPKAQKTACDDGNDCSSGDACNGAGACIGSPYSCNDGLSCTADSCDGKGACSFPILDGNCVVDGACWAAGATNPANQCQACLPGTSKVSWTAKANQTTCDDNNACTINDVCTAGACSGTAKNCEDGLACTIDSCNSIGTCIHTTNPNNCVIGGVCYASGATNPTDSCQICSSVKATDWTNQADGTTCNDGNACSSLDGGVLDGGVSAIDAGAVCSLHTCIAGACTGNCVPGAKDCDGLTPRICDATGNWTSQPSCDDGNVCTVDSCSVGACSHTPSNEGTSCSDGKICTAGVCQAPPGIVVFNDINPFDNTGMVDASNKRMVKNLVSFTSDGGRNSSTIVLMSYGHLSDCHIAPADCDSSLMSTLYATIQGLGMTVQESTSDDLSGIDPGIKVIFLWTPWVSYSVAEINAFKQFVADGGRLIFVGEWDSYYNWGVYNGIALENSFLANMGAQMTNSGGGVDCGRYKVLPQSSLRSNAITTGMTDVKMGCSSVIVPGPHDYPLYYDSTNTKLLAGVAAISTTPLVSATSHYAPHALMSTVRSASGVRPSSTGE
jgi:hypothetical protein